MSRVVDSKELVLTTDNAGENWSVAAWDPRTGSLLNTYKHGGVLEPGSLTLIADTYLLAADSTKPRLHVWHLNSQLPVPNLRLSTPGKVTALAACPSGSYIVAAVGEKLFVWQLCNGRLLAILTRHYQTVTRVKFSGDGSMFASGAEDGLVFVWSLYDSVNAEQSSPVHAFSHHSLPVKDLFFGHLGAFGRLCSVSLDRTANVYEPKSGALLLTLVFDVPLTSVCMNVRESDLFVGSTGGAIFRFNLHDPPRGTEHHVRVKESDADGGAIAYLAHKSAVVGVSISVDCSTMVSGSTDGSVHVWDIASRQVLRSLEHKRAVTTAFFVKRFENFHAADMRHSVQIRSLQRVTEEAGRGQCVEVIQRSRDGLEMLDFDDYVEKSADFAESDGGSGENEKLREEIQKLKKINSALYRYSVECILEGDRDQ